MNKIPVGCYAYDIKSTETTNERLMCSSVRFWCVEGDLKIVPSLPGPSQHATVRRDTYLVATLSVLPLLVLENGITALFGL